MNLDEVRANLNRVVIWHPPWGGYPWPVRILHLLDQIEPARVWVRLDGFMSEKDVAPEDLSIQEET